MADGEGWRAAAVRAGRTVIERRVALGYRTRAQFADDTGLTPKTLGEIERGVRPSYSPATYAVIDQALQWSAGTLESLLKADAEPLVEDPATEVQRRIRRDDFVPTWMLVNSGLDEPAMLRVQLLIRQRRERWEREVLWPEVAALIEELGGVVSYPWDESADSSRNHPDV